MKLFTTTILATVFATNNVEYDYDPEIDGYVAHALIFS